MQGNYYFGYQARERDYSIYDRRSLLFDTLIVFIPFAAILFNRILGPLTPLLVLSVTPLFILLRWERVFAVLSSCWILLLLPLFALSSAFWSDAPEVTLRYGVLYLATVLPALFIGAGCNRDSVLKGIFFAFCLYILLSFPLGRWVGWSGGGRAWAGLMGSKNASGDVAALSILCSVAMFFWSLGRKKTIHLCIAILVLLLSAFSLWASRATGALVATIVSLPCLLVWALTIQVGKQVRVSFYILSLISVVLALCTINLWMPPLFEFVMESSGKDAGLTGRDILWAKADTLIPQNPILGTGYKAFWIHNNLDAEYLWREMGVTNRSGFNFHNTPRDILVDLGIVGLVVFVIAALVGSIKLLMKTVFQPNMINIFCCTLLVFESPRFYFELIGFQNMHFATVIVFVILSYGLRPRSIPEVVD